MVCEVVPVFPLEVRGRRTLGRDEADPLAVERVREEREGEASEVRSAAEARRHQVRILTDLLELTLGLEADDRLMEEDMVQDGAEAIDRLLITARVLESLRHRDAQGSGMVRILLEERAPRCCLRTRRSVNRRAVHPHELPALGLPVVDRTDPEDRRWQPGEARRLRQRGAPLARAGLRREAFVPFLFRVPGLGESRVHLVAARRTVEFRLVVEACGSAESLLQTAGADQRPRSARLSIQVLDLRGNVDPPLCGVLLPQALADEQLREGLDA